METQLVQSENWQLNIHMYFFPWTVMTAGTTSALQCFNMGTRATGSTSPVNDACNKTPMTVTHTRTYV